ncbi:IclR family transcriptional regulator [Microbacterium sp. QXD-8]|uniref:IclR family transcriptional regulator n=1 Tax=Microbacterium psychrotolerans TaxID=3068321 RepID=A0ABU0YVT1_9MICO|nr:IclR family transcriptional regulator [Microbacterium sp. QXD-8]MDQ7876443.1 IclR family transcriptional regulator [Microbacterium sp. QXD-8]
MPDVAGDAVGVLDRMTCILEAFDGDDRGMGISELAHRAGLPKSTVSRLVATLIRQRYLERDGKLIHLGLRLFELGQLAEQPRELRIAALPVMADLRNQTGGNVHLGIRDGDEVVCIAVMRGRAPEPSTVQTGARLPLHATALGKAVLAYAPPSDIDDVLAAGLTSWTADTITDAKVLRHQLTAITRDGLAAEAGEFAAGLCCTAVAVLAPGGALAGAVSVSGQADDLKAERVAQALRTAALTLTRRLASLRPGSG